MEFCHSYLFVTFVVMTVDQIVGRDDGPLSPQRQESRKNLEQKFIFQIGTLNPHGINERFSFN